jgi:hypothetical protein
VRDFRIRESFCPWCGRSLDAAMNIVLDDSPPSPGDFTLCIGCASVLKFGPLLELLAIPDREWIKDPLCELIRNARRAIINMDRRADDRDRSRKSG